MFYNALADVAYVERSYTALHYMTVIPSRSKTNALVPWWSTIGGWLRVQKRISD